MKPWKEMTDRERDALVAEKVMGWNNVHREGDWGLFGRPFGGLRDYPIPYYSTDIAAAWEIVEALRDKLESFDFELSSFKDGTWGCTFYEFLYPQKYSRIAADAICLAALKAIGIEV